MNKGVFLAGLVVAAVLGALLVLWMAGRAFGVIV